MTLGGGGMPGVHHETMKLLNPVTIDVLYQLHLSNVVRPNIN